MCRRLPQRKDRAHGLIPTILPVTAQRPPKGRPHLHTARLRLEPMSWDHLDDLVELDADAEVMRFLGPARRRDEVVGRMTERLSPSDDALGLGFWVGFERERFCGWWALAMVRPATAELGYRLTRHAWGRGLATEGSIALIDHGFATAGVELIVAETMVVNRGSRAVMAKLGMRHTHTEMREWSDPLPGAEQGEWLTAISRAEWEAAASRRA